MQTVDSLGQRLRRARRRKFLTIEELAEQAGIHANTLRAYELDRLNPSLYKLCDLCDILGISLDWLAGRGRKT